ncbi:MAG: hypothetical protein LBT37_07285 [Lactobacillaceae bacterium]|jgi:hypothetical protein|nr:hypothetical protein [Lactobacillaceae bacterium]
MNNKIENYLKYKNKYVSIKYNTDSPDLTGFVTEILKAPNENDMDLLVLIDVNREWAGPNTFIEVDICEILNIEQMMIYGLLDKNLFDFAISIYPEAFERATKTEIINQEVKVYFKDYVTWDDWFDDFLIETISRGFNLKGDGEPTEIGLKLESIQDDLNAQINYKLLKMENSH